VRELGLQSVWGAEGFLPPAPPRLVRPLRGAPSRAGQGSANRRSPTPLHVCVLGLVASFLSQQLRLTAALIQGRGRPSGNARGAKPIRACPTLPCAHEIPAVRDLITAAPLSIYSLLRLFVKPSLARRYHPVFIAMLLTPFFRRLTLRVGGKPVHQPFTFRFVYLL